MGISNNKNNEKLSPLGLIALLHLVILPILAVPYTMKQIVNLGQVGSGVKKEIFDEISDAVLPLFPYVYYTGICILLFEHRKFFGVSSKKMAFIMCAILWAFICSSYYSIFGY